jgi:FdrA protein
MIDRLVVHPGSYVDSVTLMQVSRDAVGEAGVVQAVVVLGTPLNLELVQGQGFDVPHHLGPNDLVIAVRADSDAAADVAVEAIERMLAERGRRAAPGAAAGPSLRSVRSAARGDPDLSLAFISTPGRHAAYEIAQALERNLHVFCFSDGVDLAEEAWLKRLALDRDLILMGPDCGTAIVDGVALGFANAVARGPVGIVGASGTGTQEICSLLALAGVGISQALGVGGRDLSAEVGGSMTTRALQLLAGDPDTELIIVVSKPVDRRVADDVARAAARTGKPVVLAFPGREIPTGEPDGVMYARSIEDGARRAAEALGATIPSMEPGTTLRANPGFIRGLFCGGTLCHEAMAIVSARVGPVMSNIPLQPEWALPEGLRGTGHVFIDFGDDRLTEGRPHPMIDATLRNERLLSDAMNSGVTAIVADVVLGYGGHPDPASELTPLLEAIRVKRGDTLAVIIDLCGTAGDPQGLDGQAARLQEAGAVITRSAAQAARLALQATGVAPVG